MQKYLLTLSWFVYFFSCYSCDILSSNGEEITWHDEDLNNLVIYAYEIGGVDTLAVIDPLTSEVLKIITDFENILSVVTNADGTRLFISTGKGPAGTDPGAIYELNTLNWSHRQIYNHAAHLLSNRNGGIYFITKISSGPQRTFGSISTDDGSINELGIIDVIWRSVYDDNVIEIHPHKPLVYAIDGEKKLYQFNYETGKVKHIRPLPFARMTLSWGGDTLYIPGGPVFDLATEQTVGSIPVWHLGYLAARRDNKEVYITDPGGYLRDPLPSGRIQIYSPEHNRITDEVNVLIKGIPWMTDRIYLTPKERYGIVNDWMLSYFIIDLKRREVIYSHQFVKNNVRTLSMEGFYVALRPPGL
jgi:hypothetical protein